MELKTGRHDLLTHSDKLTLWSAGRQRIAQGVRYLGSRQFRSRSAARIDARCAARCAPARVTASQRVRPAWSLIYVQELPCRLCPLPNARDMHLLTDFIKTRKAHEIHLHPYRNCCYFVTTPPTILIATILIIIFLN